MKAFLSMWVGLLLAGCQFGAAKADSDEQAARALSGLMGNEQPGRSLIGQVATPPRTAIRDDARLPAQPGTPVWSGLSGSGRQPSAAGSNDDFHARFNRATRKACGLDTRYVSGAAGSKDANLPAPQQRQLSTGLGPR